MISTNDKLIVEAYLEENKNDIAEKLGMPDWKNISKLENKPFGEFQSEITFFRFSSQTNILDEVWLEVHPYPKQIIIMFRMQIPQYDPNFRMHPWEMKSKLIFSLADNDDIRSQREFTELVFNKIREWSVE